MAQYQNSFIDPNVQQFAQQQKSAEEQIMDQRRYAQVLQQQAQQPKGQEVSGWYVAPHWSQQLGAALSNVAGGYFSGQAQRGEADLLRNDKAEALKQYNSFLNGPSAEEQEAMKAQAAEQVPAAIFKPADPSLVGPFQPGARVRVNQTGMVSNNNPQVDPKALAEVAGQRDALFAKARQEYENKAIAGLAGTNYGGRWADRIMEKRMEARLTGPGKGDRFTVKNRDGSETVYLQKPDGSTSVLAQGAGGPDKVTQTIDTPNGLVNIMEDGSYRPASPQATSGSAGGGQAPQGPFAGIRTAKQAEAEQAAIDRQEKKATKTAELTREDSERNAKFQAKIYEINRGMNLISAAKETADDATGIGGRISNAFSTKTGIATDAKIATERIEQVKGNAMQMATALMKDQSGSASGLALAESEAIQKSIAALDPAMGTKELNRQLDSIYTTLYDTSLRVKADYEAQMAAGRGQAPAASSTALRAPNMWTRK